MKKWIDLRSFAIGGVLVLSAVYILGAAPKPTPSGPVRRFAIVVSDASDTDTYVLDTVTGQVWPKILHGRMEAAFFEPKLDARTPEESSKPGL